MALAAGAMLFAPVDHAKADAGGLSFWLPGTFGSLAAATFADVFYQGSLKWNQGVHNTMVYVSGNIPSGTYDAARLANLSFGFVAVDGGAGCTYLDPKTGREFSVVGGLTCSFINPDTQYQNGIDFHLDWTASQFVSKTVTDLRRSRRHDALAAARVV